LIHKYNMTPEQELQFNNMKQRLDKLEKSDRYVFEKDIEMATGRNVQLATDTGTKIATATNQKLGFYGTPPVDQPATVTNAGGCEGTADTKVNELRDRLQELGLIA